METIPSFKMGDDRDISLFQNGQQHRQFPFSKLATTYNFYFLFLFRTDDDGQFPFFRTDNNKDNSLFQNRRRHRQLLFQNKQRYRQLPFSKLTTTETISSFKMGEDIDNFLFQHWRRHRQFPFSELAKTDNFYFLFLFKIHDDRQCPFSELQFSPIFYDDDFFIMLWLNIEFI